MGKNIPVKSGPHLSKVAPDKIILLQNQNMFIENDLSHLRWIPLS